MLLRLCLLLATTARVLRVFESADRSFARPDNRQPLAAPAAPTRDMDSDESVASSADESGCNKPKTVDAGDHVDDGLEKMNQLVSDLTAERDRIKRESLIQCGAGDSVGRSAEFLKRANNRMEEAHTVLSGVWMTPGPMDRLPVDIIFHIMHFIPVQQVFVCMSVNKKWEEAARLTVREHKRVQLVSKDRSSQHEIQIHNPLNLMVVYDRSGNAQTLRRLSESLLLMENLSHMETSDCYIIDRKHINPVIVKNAASLQVLITNENLPSSQEGPATYSSFHVSQYGHCRVLLPPNSSPLIYQQLKKLECRFLSPGTVCPVLEELRIFPCCSLGPVDQLPILTMRKFVFRSSTRDEMDENTDSVTGLCTAHEEQDEAEEFEVKILQAAKRLVNLTHLELNFDFDVDFHAPVDDVSTLMDDFTSLIHLDLTLPHSDFAFDQKVVQLVCQNPGLRYLKLYDLDLSDIALTSVVRLQDLRHLELDGPRSRFTVTGLLTFFRSSVRPLLLFASMSVPEATGEERKEILDEIDLIAAERGKPLKAIDDQFVVPDIFTLEFED